MSDSPERPVPGVPLLDVLSAGLQTTVQDAGRRRRALGIPASGAADGTTLRVANALVGNAAGAAALEVTLRGPTLRFRGMGVVALCGAPFEATLEGQPFPLWRAVSVQPGQTLRIGTTPRGLRAVLAVRGGLRVPEVLGSRATDLRGGFGGHESAGGDGGRALRRGDVLGWEAVRPQLPPRAFVAPELRTPLGPRHVLRVCPTPEAAPDTLHLLCGREFTVSAQLDRMGARLDPAVPAPEVPGRMSLPNVPGAAQLPPDGRPILLLPDAGTHGGYPTPLIVVQADLPRLGQLRPGDHLHFRVVTPQEAAEARRSQERALRSLEAALAWWYNQA